MAAPKVLVVDVGGNNIKCWSSVANERRKTPSGSDLTPEILVRAVNDLTAGWDFDRLTIGVPGPVARNRLAMNPVNLGPGWIGFDFEVAFGKRTRVVNDAAMQAMGSYKGGRMLFLGLGTGLGNTLIVDNMIVDLELGHLPYKDDRTFEDHVGQRGLKRLGRKAWAKAVADVAERLRIATLAEDVVIGGGNAKLLADDPPLGCRLGDNKLAFAGGLRCWQEDSLVAG